MEISSCFSGNVDLGNRSTRILGKGERRYRVRKIKFLSLNIPKFSFAGIFSKCAKTERVQETRWNAIATSQQIK